MAHEIAGLVVAIAIYAVGFFLGAGYAGYIDDGSVDECSQAISACLMSVFWFLVLPIALFFWCCEKAYGIGKSFQKDNQESPDAV